jgi:hypothetical protein
VSIDLIKLAEHSAVTWSKGEAFAGETTFETNNTVYRFQDGVFSGRAKRPEAGAEPTWESPPAMARFELVGFLCDEGGLWSLSPRWRAGALAVIATSKQVYMLTSRTIACTFRRPPPITREAPEQSDVFELPVRRQPHVRRPPPPSLTRVQALPAEEPR